MVRSPATESGIEEDAAASSVDQDTATVASVGESMAQLEAGSYVR